MNQLTLITVIFALCFGTVSAFQSLPPSIKTACCIWPHERENGLKSSPSEEGEADYSTEETLMNIHVAPTDGQNESDMAQISKYTQSFPFAVVLPVQPLQYLPKSDGGVEITFLRKKTEEKSSYDGGMRFFIKEERNGYDIVCKRNSKGQTISKMFSEKQVVLAFLKGISGEETEKTGAPPPNISVESVFHKWL